MVLKGAVCENHATKPAFYEAKLRFIAISCLSEAYIIVIWEQIMHLRPKIFKICISEILWDTLVEKIAITCLLSKGFTPVCIAGMVKLMLPCVCTNSQPPSTQTYPNFRPLPL